MAEFDKDVWIGGDVVLSCNWRALMAGNYVEQDIEEVKSKEV
jgi:hypothetical protein